MIALKIGAIRKNRDGKARPSVIYSAVGIVLAVLLYMSWQTSVQPAIRVGDRAPVFALPSYDGSTVQLNDLSGTPVILRFSSRNCSYCGDDFGTLSSLQQSSDGRFQIIAIETNTQPHDIVHVLQGREVPFPILLDQNGSVARRYQVKGLPMYYWIDAEGTLKATLWGEPSASEWQHNTESILPKVRVSGRGQD